MTTGFIGLGVMGSRMARRLLDAGTPLIVRDADPAAETFLAAHGAQIASSARTLADQCEIVFCSLPTPTVVDAVVTGSDGLIEGKALRIVVDLSTTGSDRTIELSRTLSERTIALIDAPVSGGPGGVEAGTLAIMASGERAAFETVSPLLERIGSKLFYMGEKTGLGQTMKLVNNLLAASNMVAACEALVFGAKAGLSLSAMLDVINASSGRSFSTQVKIPECILSGEYPMRFSTTLLHKDVSLGVLEAEKLGVAMWVIPTVRQFLTFAITQGDGPKDYAHLIRHLEAWAGVDLLKPASPHPPSEIDHDDKA